uniref:WWE domain-containing protein n=1 Tax=Mimiviridae sp. ChoanoV1 TaxID=2596887 RepID=A0A5B8IHI9_9VIRU|nr:hypothetical protein 2_47 [Mimiviridae sp. ChoanoV1]
MSYLSKLFKNKKKNKSKKKLNKKKIGGASIKTTYGIKYNHRVYAFNDEDMNNCSIDICPSNSGWLINNHPPDTSLKDWKKKITNETKTYIALQDTNGVTLWVSQKHIIPNDKCHSTSRRDSVSIGLPKSKKSKTPTSMGNSMGHGPTETERSNPKFQGKYIMFDEKKGKWLVCRNSDEIIAAKERGDDNLEFKHGRFNYNINIIPETQTAHQINMETGMVRILYFIENKDTTSDMIRHTNMRFECLKEMITTNPSLRVIIPADMEFRVLLEGTFQKFDKRTNNFINDLYRKGKPLKFIVKGQSYEINRELTTQVNLKTGYKRKIKAIFKEQTNMGRGIGIQSWERTFPKDKTLYSRFMSNLDEKIYELRKNPRVICGNLTHTKDINVIQLWGANTKNYDIVASKGPKISGSGQAEFLGNHSISTFGIITSPEYGIPSEEKGDFNKRRLCSRNQIPDLSSITPGGGSATPSMRPGGGSIAPSGKPSMRPGGGSAAPSGTPSMRPGGGSAAPSRTTSLTLGSGSAAQSIVRTINNFFEPCIKTSGNSLVKRTPVEFIRNLELKQNKDFPIAIRELNLILNGTKERKTEHWIWSIFPQPLNIFDTLSSYPSPDSIKYSFNSLDESLAFVDNPTLLNNFKECLNLVIEIYLKNKSLDFLGPDRKKFITSINYLYKLLSTRSAESTTPDQSILFMTLKELVLLFEKGIIKGILKRKTSRKKKSRSKSKSKTRNKTRSKSKSKTRNKTRNKTRSKTRSKSRSKTRSKSRSKTRSKTRNKTRSKTRSKSRSKTRSKSRSKTRSKTRTKSK